MTSRFILQTEKNRLIAETKERLENVGRRHISLIEGQLKDREDEGKQAAKSIKAAISSISGESQLSHSIDSDGSITGISPTLACSFFLSSGAELTKELTSRILNTVKAIDLLAPALLSDFEKVTIHTTENIIVSAPPSIIPPGSYPESTPLMRQAMNQYQSFWTPVRYDFDSRMWLTTLVVPLHHVGRYLGTLSSPR